MCVMVMVMVMVTEREAWRACDWRGPPLMHAIGTCHPFT